MRICDRAVIWAAAVVCVAWGSAALAAEASVGAPAAFVEGGSGQKPSPAPLPPPKTCCACIYQDGGEALGSCESRQSEEQCGDPSKGPCRWDEGKCVANWKSDCEGPGSPFSKAMAAMPDKKCDVTGVFPNASFLDAAQPAGQLPAGQVPDSLQTWSSTNQCTDFVGWYTGHGQGYATSVPQVLCDLGLNSGTFTCTGCSGMGPKKDLQAMKAALCAKLKAGGKPAKVTTTGNQTCVTSYAEMSQKTVTVSWTPPNAECDMKVEFAPCSQGRKSCDGSEEGRTYQCNNGKGIVTKTCTCLLGLSCGFK